MKRRRIKARARDFRPGTILRITETDMLPWIEQPSLMGHPWHHVKVVRQTTTGIHYRELISGFWDAAIVYMPMRQILKADQVEEEDLRQEALDGFLSKVWDLSSCNRYRLLPDRFDSDPDKLACFRQEWGDDLYAQFVIRCPVIREQSLIRELNTASEPPEFKVREAWVVSEDQPWIETVLAVVRSESHLRLISEQADEELVCVAAKAKLDAILASRGEKSPKDDGEVLVAPHSHPVKIVRRHEDGGFDYRELCRGFWTQKVRSCGKEEARSYAPVQDGLKKAVAQSFLWSAEREEGYDPTKPVRPLVQKHDFERFMDYWGEGFLAELVCRLPLILTLDYIGWILGMIKDAANLDYVASHACEDLVRKAAALAARIRTGQCDLGALRKIAVDRLLEELAEDPGRVVTIERNYQDLSLYCDFIVFSPRYLDLVLGLASELGHNLPIEPGSRYLVTASRVREQRHEIIGNIKENIFLLRLALDLCGS